jgi:hypothetical protein
MLAIAGGMVGPLDLLAAHTGWPPERVRSALKEMSRAGEAQVRQRQATGRRGAARGVYGLPLAAPEVDALAFAQRVWR